MTIKDLINYTIEREAFKWHSKFIFKNENFAVRIDKNTDAFAMFSTIGKYEIFIKCLDSNILLAHKTHWEEKFK